MARRSGGIDHPRDMAARLEPRQLVHHRRQWHAETRGKCRRRDRFGFENRAVERVLGGVSGLSAMYAASILPTD